MNKYQEAIEVEKLKHAISSIKTYMSYPNGRLCRAAEIAIEAIEKQIPQMPVYGDYQDNGYGEIVPMRAECPTCGCEIPFGNWNSEDGHHCPCGQSLEWEV